MKVVVIALYLLLVFSSCSIDDPVSPATQPPSQESLEALKFFPLKVGNYWEYLLIETRGSSLTTNKDTLRYSTKIVKDTLLSNGKNYWVLEKIEFYSSSWTYSTGFTLNVPDSIPKIYYIYVDSVNAKIYRRSTEASGVTENILENALSNVGESYFGSSPWYISTNSADFICRDLKEGIVLGFNTTIKEYSTNGYYLWHKLAKNLGYVYGSADYGNYNWTHYVELLRTANINGVEYKNLIY